MTLHTLICPFLWTTHISECHRTLSLSSSTRPTVVSWFVYSHTRSAIAKFLRYTTYSPPGQSKVLWPFTFHWLQNKKKRTQKSKKQKQKQKTGTGSQTLCLRSLCFGTRNLNLANLTPKSALAYDGFGDILGNSAPPREPVFSCLMHPSILFLHLPPPSLPFLSFFFSFKFLIIRPL